MPLIEATTASGISVLALNRPARGNAMNFPMFQELQVQLKRAAEDPKVLAVVLTGNGTFFSSGADVTQLAAGGMPEDFGPGLRNNAGKTTKLVIDFPKPLIAAVNGPVVGYPAGLLGIMDLVFVSEKASYRAPFLQLGIVPEGCSSRTLVQTVGTALANDVWYNGRVLSASEMVQAGIASRVLPAANFREEVLTLVATGIGSCSVASMAKTKSLVRNEDERKRLHEVNEAELAAVIARFQSGEPVKRFMKVMQALNTKRSERASKL